MSERYPGGFITKTPTAPTSSSAPGIWTLDQAMQNQKAGNWPSPPSPYIEDWFSTYLYTGNDAALTVTNGINLSTYGGLVWGKSRSASQNHRLYDTARGSNYSLISNDTAAQSNQGANACAFNTNGFSLSAASGIVGSAGFGGPNYVSWTFAKRQKFFDIVTYTGDGTTNQTIPHNLGSTPGCIITKRTDSTGNWTTWHTSFADTKTYIYLNTTDASVNVPGATAMTVSSTSFTVGSNQIFGNGSGFTYVAYLFAHNAGGFGLTGSDNVISCGSFTTDGSGNATVTLGYEPQWFMVKSSSNVSNWAVTDNMRGMTVGHGTNYNPVLVPNSTAAENTTGESSCIPTATGFYTDAATFGASRTYIYIAIRRGPMKVPTTGTSVFVPVAQNGAGTVTTNFPVDLSISTDKAGANDRVFMDRLRGGSTTAYRYLASNSIASEASGTTVGLGFDSNTTLKDNWWNSTQAIIFYSMRRAPNFFDEVCYTGTGSNPNAVSHNLTVIPELIITKRRSATSNWFTFYNITGSNFQRAFVDLTNAGATWTYSDGAGLGAAPTSTTFTLDTASGVNASASTYVAYLFATCAGVSKVGSYTGTAALLTVNCGFTSGARFVLIKRTDSTGDWYVYDSARGISSGNDPYLLMNSTAAETTGTNYVDTDTTGFKVTAAAPVGLNASGGTYIFLAIA